MVVIGVRGLWVAVDVVAVVENGATVKGAGRRGTWWAKARTR